MQSELGHKVAHACSLLAGNLSQLCMRIGAARCCAMLCCAVQPLPTCTSLWEMMAAPSSRRLCEWGGMLPGEMPPMSAGHSEGVQRLWGLAGNRIGNAMLLR